PHARALGQPVGVLGERRVVPLRHQPGQRLPLAADRRPAAAARPGRAAALLAGGPQPGGERPLAYLVEPRDLGLAALAGLAGRERPLAQVGGVGTRHRSPPVGVKVTSTADRGAGPAVGPAIRSSSGRPRAPPPAPLALPPSPPPEPTSPAVSQ